MTRISLMPAANPVDLHLGARLQRRRDKVGLKPEELDQAIGDPPGTVSRFERGTKGIGGAQLFLLGKALGVDVSFFFEGLPSNPSLDLRLGDIRRCR